MFDINPESFQEDMWSAPVIESLLSPAGEESVREQTRVIKAMLDALIKSKGKA